MRRLFSWFVEQDGWIRGHYPKLWHLQTLYVICFTVLGTILSTLVAVLVPVEPTRIPSIEPGYFTLLLGCAVAACIWLVRLARPMRWDQLAMPFAAPSLALAAVHGAVLFLPAFVYGTTLEHEIKNVILPDEAAIKIKTLRHYRDWQNYLINTYLLLKFSDPPSAIAADQSDEETETPSRKKYHIDFGLNKVAMFEARNGSSPFVYYISAESFESDIQFPVPIGLFGDLSKAKARLLSEGYADKADNNLQDCASIAMIRLFLDIENVKAILKTKQWPSPIEVKDQLKKSLYDKLGDKEAKSAFDDWIDYASAVRLNLSRIESVSSDFNIPYDDLAADMSQSCPRVIIADDRRGFFPLAMLDVPESSRESVSQGRNSLHAIINTIIKRHYCCAIEGPLNDQPWFLDLGKPGELERVHLADAASRVTEQLRIESLVEEQLSRAQRANAKNIYTTDSFEFMSYSPYSLFWRETAWFGSRFLQVWTIFLCLTGLLLIFVWRILGNTIGAMAFWTAGACLALSSILYPFDLWTWALAIGSGILLLSLGVAIVGLLRPIVGNWGRVAAAVGLILVPPLLVATWFYLANFCKASQALSIQCFGELGDVGKLGDVRLPLALAGLSLMVAISEGYLAILQRVIIKPR
jgi:hypothetical protein